MIVSNFEVLMRIYQTLENCYEVHHILRVLKICDIRISENGDDLIYTVTSNHKAIHDKYVPD